MTVHGTLRRWITHVQEGNQGRQYTVADFPLTRGEMTTARTRHVPEDRREGNLSGDQTHWQTFTCCMWSRQKAADEGLATRKARLS